MELCPISPNTNRAEWSFVPLSICKAGISIYKFFCLAFLSCRAVQCPTPPTRRDTTRHTAHVPFGRGPFGSHKTETGVCTHNPYGVYATADLHLERLALKIKKKFNLQPCNIFIIKFLYFRMLIVLRRETRYLIACWPSYPFVLNKSLMMAPRCRNM
jgi:hypothetical protein